jgi:probable DNA repair protein
MIESALSPDPLSRPRFDRDALLDAVADGATVITPNRRLAADLRSRFDARQLARGHLTWDTADCLSWEAWVARSFDHVARDDADSVVLSEAQAALGWAQIVRAHLAETSPLVDAAAAARSSRDAWHLAHLFRFDPARDAPSMWRSAETDAFVTWCEHWRRRLAQSGWIDPAWLPDLLAARWPRQRCAWPSRLWFEGFDAWPPQRAALVDAMRAAGVAVTAPLAGTVPGDTAPAACRAIACADAATELRVVASLVRDRLDAEPNARIGVVVPDLARRRAAVARVLHQALDPRRWHDAGAPRAVDIDVSAPLALADTAPVAAALAIVTIGVDALRGGATPLADVGAWLRGAHVAGGETELDGRARLDVRLRERVGDPCALATLERAARGTPDTAQLARALGALRRAVDASSPRARALPSTWSERFSAWLGAAGWPGERVSTSADWQTVEKWRATLESLAQFDLVAGRVDAATAAAHLRTLARDTAFQPEADAAAAVQVLGVLEADGLDFDLLVVVGLDDLTWPRPARPDPWLPPAWQRSAGVPGASAEGQLVQAQRHVARWCGHARDVVATWALRDGEAPRRPSPSIDAWPRAVAAPDASPAERQHADGAASVAIEYLDEPSGPPLAARTAADGATARGGVTVIADQAACAFRAFARHRLSAHAPPAPRHGLDDRERGALVHAALAALWPPGTTQAEVCGASVQARAARIEAAVTDALAALCVRRADLAPRTGLLAVERRRLARLLDRLIELESGRAAPFTVVGSEIDLAVDVGDLKLRGRVDRLDRLDGVGLAPSARAAEAPPAAPDAAPHAAPHDAFLILDYKTSSKIATQGWNGPRPDDPQLPLYALQPLPGGRAAGIAFVQAHPLRVRFAGVAQQGDAWLPGIARATSSDDGSADPEADWEAQRHAWADALRLLADEFLRGVAGVTPKYGAKTCEFCDLQPLCRFAVPDHHVDDLDADEAADDTDGVRA